VDDNIYAVVPGKFSLAFSLAVNTFKRLTGEMPVKTVCATTASAQAMVLPPLHASIVLSALQEEYLTKLQNDKKIERKDLN